MHTLHVEILDQRGECVIFYEYRYSSPADFRAALISVADGDMGSVSTPHGDAFVYRRSGVRHTIAPSGALVLSCSIVLMLEPPTTSLL